LAGISSHSGTSPHLAETKQLEGALVTIDAVGCQVAIADEIVEHKADYLLALKGNQ
jgi:predicted transposase YbfD/YdcC